MEGAGAGWWEGGGAQAAQAGGDVAHSLGRGAVGFGRLGAGRWQAAQIHGRATQRSKAANRAGVHRGAAARLDGAGGAVVGVQALGIGAGPEEGCPAIHPAVGLVVGPHAEIGPNAGAAVWVAYREAGGDEAAQVNDALLQELQQVVDGGRPVAAAGGAVGGAGGRARVLEQLVW